MKLDLTAPITKKIALIVLFALLYFVGIPAGNAFLSAPGYSTAFWPNSGLFLAALLLSGYRLWPLIVMVAITAETAGNVTLHGDALDWTEAGLVGAVYGLINSLAAITGAFLLYYYLPRPLDLSKLKGVMGLAFFGLLVGPAVGATLGAEFLTTV